jgi:hypothetical protein
MGSRVLLSCRLLVAAMAMLAVAVTAPVNVFAADDTFDVTGTVYSKNEDKETIVLITDDLGKKNQPITISMTGLSGNFIALREGQSVTLEIKARESDTYKAYSIVGQGSYTDGADLGTQERYETQDASIKAHVGNVPEDDESLNQQHRDNHLKRGDDDDDQDTSGGGNDEN